MDKYGEPPTTQRSHGYSAGRIEFGDGQTILRIWPRVATNKTGPWRFVPDHDHAELIGDEAKAPEPVVARPRDVGQPFQAVETRADSLERLSHVAPHSTLPSRRSFIGRKPDLEKFAQYLLPEDRSWGVVLDGRAIAGGPSTAVAR